MHKQPTNTSALHTRILFWITGAAALLWFLVRVIPKPQRATYPCMKAAFPAASAFVVALAGITGAWLLAFRSPLARLCPRTLHKAIMPLALSVAAAAFVVLFTGIIPAIEGLGAASTGVDRPQLPNAPMGVARGIFPGRVVWVHDPDATNQACQPSSQTSPWWDPANTDMQVVDAMLSRGIRDLTGADNDKSAWDLIFRHHNVQVGKGDVPYSSGEKIMIKTNATSTWVGNIDRQTMAQVATSQYYGMSETSPQVILALLRQLVNLAGVEQKDIYVGDPMKHIYESHYQLWHHEFPDVHYLDNSWSAMGREIASKSSKAKINYSDKRTVLSVGEDRLYALYDQAEYLLNIPTLKGHKFAGVTMFAKNHFGSQTRNDANHLHAGLVKGSENSNKKRSGYGLYRVQVDLMGHRMLGKKNLFFLMDALYTAKEELGRPVKWYLPPFNKDWTSSLFLSFDNVAIESVGYDFLKAEFNGLETQDSYPQMSGTDDYLEQAADSANWPAGIVYDPDASGTPIPSLGVHEHWNNPTDKKYSRNLGSGSGIELVPVEL